MGSRVKSNQDSRSGSIWNSRDRSNEETLLEAISCGTKDDVEKILGPDSHPTLFSQDALDYALRTACEGRKSSIIEILLRSGAKAEHWLNLFLMDVTKGRANIEPEDLDILQHLLEGSDTNLGRDYLTYVRKAVEVESWDLIKLFCQKGVNSSNILSFVAAKGRCDLIDLLLSCKADVNIEQSSCEAAVYWAVKNGHSDCIPTLLKHCGEIDVTKIVEAAVQGNKLETLKLFPQLYMTAFQNIEFINQIFHRLVKLGNVEFLKFLVEMRKNVMSLIQIKDQLLMDASNFEVLQFLIDHGVAVNDSVEMCNHLLRLVRQRRTDMVKLFLDSGINVNSRKFKARLNGTILMEATSAEMVQLLIDNGERVNERVSVKKFGEKRAVFTTALLEALHKEDEVVKVLLENGADPEVTNSEGHSVLMAASQIPKGSAKVEMLLKAGAQVNRQNKQRKTALSLAVGSHFTTDTVKLLLQYGADVNLQTSNKTALQNAIVKKNFDKVEMLTKSGLSIDMVNMSNKHGIPFLILIVVLFTDVQSSKLVDSFVTAGADVNKTDLEGVTALMRAAENKKHLTVKALLKAGANVNCTVRESNSICSAISLALKKSSHICSTLLCIEELLNHGAETHSVKQLDLEWLIVKDASWLIPKIIQNGCVPLEAGRSSLLSAALNKGNIELAQYLLGNRILTKSDVSFKIKRNSRCVNLLNDLTSLPFSLLTLSFVEVSTALGFGPGREDRVRKVRLPLLMQTKLLLKTEEVSLIVDEEKKKERLGLLN